jgi:hypothetical protein
VALVQEGALVEFWVCRPGAPDGVGDLLVGRVSEVVAPMAGRFVATGGADGFLPDSDCPVAAPSGTLLGVRITRAAQGGKGPRLTARLSEAEQIFARGRPVGLVRRGADALTRLAARFPDAVVRVDDLSVAAALHPTLGERVRRVAQAFGDALADEVAGLAADEVGLEEGGRLQITPTPALTAIDVDAGGAASGGGSKTASLERFNRHVLPAIARQIRLRNLSGAILVDLAGLSAKRRRALAPAFSAALAADPLQPKLLGFTALGLAEIVRPRIHPPLHEVLAGAHAAGLAALRRVVAESMAGQALTLRAAPAIVDCLRADGAALADLAQHIGRALIMRADPALAPDQWIVEAA